MCSALKLPISLSISCRHVVITRYTQRTHAIDVRNGLVICRARCGAACTRNVNGVVFPIFDSPSLTHRRMKCAMYANESDMQFLNGMINGVLRAPCGLRFICLRDRTSHTVSCLSDIPPGCSQIFLLKFNLYRAMIKRCIFNLSK